jgi:hypothetical protein
LLGHAFDEPSTHPSISLDEAIILSFVPSSRMPWVSSYVSPINLWELTVLVTVQ